MSWNFAFSYEPREQVTISRWELEGVNTRPDGNCSQGRLWFKASQVDQVVTLDFYRCQNVQAEDLVARSTVDLTQHPQEGAFVELVQMNASGLSGRFWLASYSSCPSELVMLVVTLCCDSDLELHHASLSDLPGGVFDPTLGMSKYCQAGSRDTLMRVAELYWSQLRATDLPAGELEVEFRRIAQVEQLRKAAIHTTLVCAFGACHEQSGDTMYSDLRDYHRDLCKEATSGWNLLLLDGSDSSLTRKSAAISQPTRL